jgi:uncharacterized protein (TIGR02118 family)
MIAAISLMRRRDDVPLARFRGHWLDIHGPLVCRFAGLRRYVQCHVIDNAATNPAARSMRIDGFPILFFDNDADRLKAHGSPEMAECNIDSRQFIGAVSRVITEPEDVVPSSGLRSSISLIVLFTSGDDTNPETLQNLRGLRGLVRYHVREQAPAPNSTVPHLPVTISSIAQAWFGSLVDLEAAVAARHDPAAATFVVEEHWLAPIEHNADTLHTADQQRREKR